MARVVGEQQLMHRLHAIGNKEGVMKLVTVYTIGLMKTNQRAVGARKTGTTAASLQPRVTSPTKGAIYGSPVNVWIDTGTGLYGPMHRRITPLARKALKFAVGGAGSLRLSGRARKGKAGAGARTVIVRSVKGMKARPYIARSLKEASEKVGAQISGEIVRRWDQAK